MKPAAKNATTKTSTSSPAVSRAKAAEQQKSPAVSRTKTGDPQQAAAVSKTKNVEQSPNVSRTKNIEQSLSGSKTKTTEQSPAVSRTKTVEETQSPAVNRTKSKEESPALPRQKSAEQQQPPAVSRVKTSDQRRSKSPNVSVVTKTASQQGSPAVARAKTGVQQESPAVSRARATDQKRSHSPATIKTKTTDKQVPQSFQGSALSEETAKSSTLIKPTSTPKTQASSPKISSTRRTSCPATSSLSSVPGDTKKRTSPRKGSLPATSTAYVSPASKSSSKTLKSGSSTTTQRDKAVGLPDRKTTSSVESSASDECVSEPQGDAGEPASRCGSLTHSADSTSSCGSSKFAQTLDNKTGSLIHTADLLSSGGSHAVDIASSCKSSKSTADNEDGFVSKCSELSEDKVFRKFGRSSEQAEDQSLHTMSSGVMVQALACESGRHQDVSSSKQHRAPNIITELVSDALSDYAQSHDEIFTSEKNPLIRPKTSPAPVPVAHHQQSRYLDEISSSSLMHLREIWSAGGDTGHPGTSPRSKESKQKGRSSSVHDIVFPKHTGGGELDERQEEKGEGGHAKGEEGEGMEEEEEEEPEVTFFRDRRPSAVYFTPDKAEGFPWLTWSSIIHPDQVELHPSPRQRVEATQDPNYILNLILTIGDVIGQGQYGKVHVASIRSPEADAADKLYALKKVAKAGEETTVHALAEQRALDIGKGCPFIVRMHACFQTKLAFYLLLELAEGGRLTDVLNCVGRLPENNVRFYAAQLFSAVAFLHDNNILHRDLKLDNVLLDGNGYLRLCDFGLSMDEFRDDDQVASPCGTLFYVAPEVLRGEVYGKSADWWSYGVLLYRMATGLLPFNGKNIQELYIAVTRKEPFFDSFLSPSLVSLLEQLLTKMPDKRPGKSAEERQALKDHRFFSGVDWDALHARSLVPPELPSRGLFPTMEGDGLRVDSDSILSASFPLQDLLDMTPADRDRASKQTRSRSLGHCGLLPLRTADENS